MAALLSSFIPAPGQPCNPCGRRRPENAQSGVKLTREPAPRPPRIYTTPPELSRDPSAEHQGVQDLYEYHEAMRQEGYGAGPSEDSRDRIASGRSESLLLQRIWNPDSMAV